jgi:Domain of unknown function (DUF4271)
VGFSKYLHNIITILCCFLSIHVSLQAQTDSSKRSAAPTSQPIPPINTIPSSSTTVTPVEVPINTYENRTKRRPRRLTAADSLRIALAKQDSTRKADSLIQLTAALNNPNNAVNTNINQVLPASAIPEVPILQNSDNPFDILRGGVSAADTTVQQQTNISTTPSIPSAGPSLLDKKTYSKNFLFWIFLITLTFMAFVVANARYMIRDAYSAVLNNNALRQVYKEPIGWGNIAYLALYGLFWINMGILAFLLMSQLGLKLPHSQSVTLLLCIGGASAIFLAKHLILYIVANVFPIEKEIKTYNFIILTAGIMLGLILMPLNIFIAYTSYSVSEIFIYLAVGAIGLTYLVRSLRSLSIASPYLIENRFHFFLYICTVEIAPLMILVKLLLSKGGSSL